MNSYYYTEWDSHLSSIFYDFEEQDHFQVVSVVSWGNALAHKQAQLITMHNFDFSDKGRAIRVVLINLLNTIHLFSNVYFLESFGTRNLIRLGVNQK